jgi:hypothetical protein
MEQLLFGLAIIFAVIVLFGRSKRSVPSDVASMILGQGILAAGEDIVFVATIPMSNLPFGSWSRRDQLTTPPRYFVLTSKSVLLLGLSPRQLHLVQRIPFAELVDARIHGVEGNRACVALKIQVEQKLWITGPIWTVSGEISPRSAGELLLQVIQESRPELKLVTSPA